MARIYRTQAAQEELGKLHVSPPAPPSSPAAVEPASDSPDKKVNEPKFPMKTDNQHLDFLISQYVDGSLEGTGKKTVEQQLLTDPSARKLYAEHQEVQDVLDDWGNRIPMIDWDGFDKKLDQRLEKEAREKERVSIFRRRMRPVAAAAALLLAAGIGYGWHAFAGGDRPALGSPSVEMANTGKGTGVQFPDMPDLMTASRQSLTVEMPAVAKKGAEAQVVISAPDDAMAVKSLMDSLVLSPINLEEAAKASHSNNGSVSSSDAGTDFERQR